MKFKAFLTENGVNLLEKRFLQALDKMGKICHLYLTRDHAIFLHNLLNGDGIQCIAQFRKEALFDDYRISSQNDNRIAFAIDVSLLHRAVRSSVSICTEFGGDGPTANRLQIKLVKKLPPNCTQPMPFLTFETKGYKSAVIQDVPIAKPLSRAEVLELQTALDMAQDLPQTLVQVPDLNQLQNFVERMKHVGDLLNVSISKYGDLHVQISTTLITLGAEFRKLVVVGEQAEVPAEDRNLSAQTRSERAILRGDAQSVQVSVRHFSKSLQCHLAKPDCAFYGIAPQGFPYLTRGRVEGHLLQLSIPKYFKLFIFLGQMTSPPPENVKKIYNQYNGKFDPFDRVVDAAVVYQKVHFGLFVNFYLHMLVSGIVDYGMEKSKQMSDITCSINVRNF